MANFKMFIIVLRVLPSYFHDKQAQDQAKPNLNYRKQESLSKIEKIQSFSNLSSKAPFRISKFNCENIVSQIAQIRKK